MCTVPHWCSLRELRYSAEGILQWAEIEGPPVDVRWIAATLKVPVQQVPGYPNLAAARVEQDAAHIWIRDEAPESTMRFAIAWGLGHILRGPRGDVFSEDRFAGGPPFEFGLDLLMPPYWFGLGARAHHYDAEALSHEFGVDEGAIDARFYSLRRQGIL